MPCSVVSVSHSYEPAFSLTVLSESRLDDELKTTPFFFHFIFPLLAKIIQKENIRTFKMKIFLSFVLYLRLFAKEN